MDRREANGDAAFIVRLDRFQGPLDLLLHLIREQDIDIFDIPIAKITEQFLQAIEGVETLGLDRAGEFLETAALLVRIKAQMLMPPRSEDGEDLEDPRAALVRRLLEYEYFREAAQRLEAAETDRLRLYARGFVPPRPEPDPEVELSLDWDALWLAARGLEERQRAPAEHHLRPRLVTVDEKMDLIVSTLRRLARVEFHRLVAPYADRMHAVATFVASLELAKRRTLAIRQSKPFAPVWLYRRNGATPDGADADH